MADQQTPPAAELHQPPLLEPAQWILESNYQPPESPSQVKLDVVTVTANRPHDLLVQARHLSPQLNQTDRWLIVDDASHNGLSARDLLSEVPSVRPFLLHIGLGYSKGATLGTINRARHCGCSLARLDAWIVELDDHDSIMPGSLDLVREAICRGALFVYGDVLWAAHGTDPKPFQKPDYTPYLLRDVMCPTEGVRAYPKFLYEAVGGYRWAGEIGEVGGNEFPGGDFGVFVRIEQLCEGRGFYRIPVVLNVQPKVAGSISGRYSQQQYDMCQKLRQAAREGKLL